MTQTPPPLADAAPAPVLSYAEPPRHRSLALRLWFSLAAFLIAVGAGTAVFGLMMAVGYRDDYAGPTGIGVGLLLCGIFLMAGVLWHRFGPRLP